MFGSLIFLFINDVIEKVYYNLNKKYIIPTYIIQLYLIIYL